MCVRAGSVFAVVAASFLALASACSDDPTTANGRSSGSSGSSGASGASGTSGATPEPSGPPAIGFVGRFDTRDPAKPKAAWPGVRIIARFEGSAISAKLEEAEIQGEEEQPGPSEWDVIVDGKVTKKVTLAIGTRDYELAKGLPAGKHVVELYKRSEAQTGVTTFHGFDYAGGTLLAPPVRPDRRIEIIGDSAASAFGIEGVGEGPDCPGLDWGAKWQNFHLSFGARLGETFGADVHGTVFSGKGFSRNIWRPDDQTLGKIYRRSNPVDQESTYELASWKPDAVVILAGGNDFAEGQPQDNGPASLEEFTDAYDELVGTVRTAYPNAHLFLTLSTSVRDDEPAGRNTRTNIKNGIRAVVGRHPNDEKLHAEEPPAATEAELTACDGHGSPEHQQRLANDLAKSMKPKLGW